MKLHSGPQIGPVFGTRFQKYFLSWGTLGSTASWGGQWDVSRNIRQIPRLEIREDRGTDSGKSSPIWRTSHYLCWSNSNLLLQPIHEVDSESPRAQRHLGHLNGPESPSLHEQPPLWTGDLQTHIKWPLRSRGILLNCVEVTNAGCDRISSNEGWEGYLAGERRRRWRQTIRRKIYRSQTAGLRTRRDRDCLSLHKSQASQVPHRFHILVLFREVEHPQNQLILGTDLFRGFRKTLSNASFENEQKLHYDNTQGPALLLDFSNSFLLILSPQFQQQP